MENKKVEVSLGLIIENTKKEMRTAVNQVICQSGLPAYLIEGVLTEILAEVRKQVNMELVEELTAPKQNEQNTEKEEGAE